MDEDIVDRLRVLNFMGPWKEAADEIERLRDEIYNLKLAVAGGEDAPGSADLVGPEDVIMWRKLWADEIEKLRGTLREIYEVYAGSEGIPQPMTAAEGYLLSLLMEVVRIAQKALKEKE